MRAGVPPTQVVGRVAWIFPEEQGAELLRHDALAATQPWMREKDGVVHLHRKRDGSLDISAMWESERPAARVRRLRGLERALAKFGLAMRDRSTRVPRTERDLAADTLETDAIFEVYRVADVAAESS